MNWGIGRGETEVKRMIFKDREFTSFLHVDLNVPVNRKMNDEEREESAMAMNGREGRDLK